MSSFLEELEKDIIPFWTALRDEQNGGFIGYCDSNGVIDGKAQKGGVLNSRILWFFSNCSIVLGRTDLLVYAEHAFRFLKDRFIDGHNGGVYWSLNYDGSVYDDGKHTYNNAFAIYALCAYYEAAGDSAAKEAALALFELTEQKCRDEYGYVEAFSRDFSPVENEKLSENGVHASKTMNTVIHLIEAYTDLYRLTGEKKVAAVLKKLLTGTHEKMYDGAQRRLNVFFDKHFNSLADMQSFGHDIEAAWLIDKALDVLNDASFEKLYGMTGSLCASVLDRAFDGNALCNEMFEGVIDDSRIWWVQAEAIVGFTNAYRRTRNNVFLSAAQTIWKYIKEHIIDDDREWFWQVDKYGRPLAEKPKASLWKCPYHNGRLCLEMVREHVEF
jgi:mannobiose 2-epimerase